MKIDSDDPETVKIGATRKELYAGMLGILWLCEKVFS